MKTLTISRKIALGFTALVLVTAILGGVAFFSMRSVQASSRSLVREYIPEVDVTGDLQRQLSAAQLAIRSYGYTAELSQLEEARKHLHDVSATLDRTRKLANEHRGLIHLREGLAKLESAEKAFQDAVNATEAVNLRVAATRRNLDEAAAGFVANIDHLIEAQQTRMTGEIKAAAASAELLDRAGKLALAQEIRGLGNAARIAAFKAQALRDVGLFADGAKSFEVMETRFGELLRTLKVKADIDELNKVRTHAHLYRDALQSLASEMTELEAAGRRRLEAATMLASVANATQDAGINQAVDAAVKSDELLASANLTVLGGIGIALALGVGIALVIIRTTSRTLMAVAESLSETSTQVTAAASQVAAASQTLAEGATEQAASLEETSASLEELSSMTRRNAEGAQQAKDLSNLTRGSADLGAAHMQEMRDAMAAIKASSDDIAKIIKTIDEIAFQTNILALNAAVEAARAGEAGMGFAVVAEEVRSLAQRSAQSAKETAAKIEDAIRKSEHGVAISGKVAATLADIVDRARKVDGLVGEIATASSEQSQGINQLNTAVAQMDKVTQSNASSAEESAAAAEELSAQALAMQQAVLELRRLVTTAQVASPGSEAPRPSERGRVPTRGKVGAAPRRTRGHSLDLTPAPVPSVNGHDEHFAN